MARHIAHVLHTQRRTLLSDFFGVLALAGMTLGVLHLPGLI
ncbi:MAG: hypothetical protein AAFN09_01560 [Pseudomonadota bacterium]